MNYSDILLTVDFERTLTAPDSTVPERNKQAIRDFMALGGTFTVNTGRSLPMYGDRRFEVSVNAPLLLYNGSAAVDQKTGEILRCKLFDFGMEQTVRDMMARYPDMVVEVQGVDAHYIFKPHAMWAQYCRENGCTYAFANPEDDLGPFMKFTFYEEFRKPTVADLYNATPEQLARMDQVEADLKQLFGSRASVFRAAPRIIDVHAGNVSKAIAARELQRELGKKLLICVGDGENDVPMMEDADFSFCPSDSVLVDRFPSVCPCAEGSVADVIYEKIPQILAENP